MDIQFALEKLFSMHQFSIKLGLDNITQLLDHLGNPQNNFQTVHIAGSNGKGSTASFIASILMEAGYKTALYTSPHFVRFNERIRINGIEISDDYIENFIAELNVYIDKNKPTFFEITTALAFQYFADAKVDIGVIETGLGGRLDATNTINPLGSVITSISYEHTRILGESIEQIAIEKAGIIKQGRKVFLGSINSKAEKVLFNIAQEKNCEILSLKDSISENDDSIKLKLNNFNYHLYSIPLRGFHQFRNASLAILVVNNLFGIENIDVINNGIQKLIENTGIQGRFEIYNQKPVIIFDAAHNSEGVRSFIDEYQKEYSNFRERVLVFGAMKDKDISDMLNCLAPYFHKIYFTAVGYERAATVEEMLKIAEVIKLKTERLENPSDFVNKFKESEFNDCLVLLGSIYLLGKIKSELVEIKT